MENDRDEQIKQFITKDKNIPEKINNTFNSFIDKVKNDQIENDNIVNFDVPKQEESKKVTPAFYMFKKFATVAACLLVVFVASNVYARTQGYDNIFFMIKDLTTPKEQPTEIFQDKDIIISYKYFNVTDNVEMQINELQVKDNMAKLYLLVRELADNSDTPFSYKVYDGQNAVLYDGKSKKREDKKTYTEVLELSRYKESTDEIKLEIYSKNNDLLKSVKINLNDKTIEARTVNQEVKQISQIELNRFLKQETEKLYSDNYLKNRQVVILETYDIFYNNGKYVVKYLFMIPTEAEFENDKVEETSIYSNTVEFTEKNGTFSKVSIDKAEEV